MNRPHVPKSARARLAVMGIAALVVLTPLAACSATPATSAAAPSSTAASGSSGGQVVPVDTNPIVNTSTNAVLQISYAALEDNVDPATGNAIDDQLELTLKNTGSSALTGVETFYTFTDATTGATESYYQALDSVSVPPGGETTVFFDGGTGAGHFPENQFSLYRSSVNQVDVEVQVSADGAQIATASAVKGAGTGEKKD